MRVLHLSKRMAATGVATALTAAALVVGAATTADAATANNDYTCVVPLIGNQTFPVTVTSEALDLTDSIPAGFTFPAGMLDTLSTSGHAIAVAMTAPAIVVQTLGSIGTLTGVSAPDLAIPFGASSVPVTGLTMTTAPVVNPDGTAVFTLVGSNGAFSAPAAGPADVTLPSAFQFIATTDSLAFPVIPVDCTTDSPATIKQMTVTKNDSTTIARPAAVPFHKGKAAKMKVTVSAPNHTPSGSVLIKQGTKTLGKGTLTAGKVVINMGTKLPVGKHSVVVKYVGDAYTNASKKSLTFKVAR